MTVFGSVESLLTEAASLTHLRTEGTFDGGVTIIEAGATTGTIHLKLLTALWNWWKNNNTYIIIGQNGININRPKNSKIKLWLIINSLNFVCL